MVCFLLTVMFNFSVQSKLAKPKAMEPLAPTAVRGPVPIPPQRANKTANSVSSGINPPKSTSALPPNLNNSVSTNQTNKGNTQTHFRKVQQRCINGSQRFNCIISLYFPNELLMLASDVRLIHLLLNVLFLKIQFNHLPQTLALRTTSTTLSKWRKRRIIRIAQWPPGSLLLSLLYLLAKPPTLHPILCLLHQSLKKELCPYRLTPSQPAPNQSKLTIRDTKVYRKHWNLGYLAFSHEMPKWNLSKIFLVLNNTFSIAVVSCQGLKVWTGHCLGVTAPLPTA